MYTLKGKIFMMWNISKKLYIYTEDSQTLQKLITVELDEASYIMNVFFLNFSFW